MLLEPSARVTPDGSLVLDRVPVDPGTPSDRSPAAAARASVTATVSALALAACGEGSGASGDVAAATAIGTPPATDQRAIESLGQASRFLGQATLGATRAEIESVHASGTNAWIDAQFAKPRAISHWDWLVSKGFNAVANRDTSNGFDATMWRQLIASEDQLRQRVGLALSEIFVVGIGGLNTNWVAFASAAYFDVLLDNAFGNYRDIIEKISLNAAMGIYLTFNGNRKANPSTGTMPDENYARELMQLFTIGVNKLNPDGTLEMNGGQPIETYTPADVSGLARVFTGWTLDGSDSSIPDRLRRPLVQNAANHETGIKSFLGTTIPAGTSGADSLQAAIDTIFAHPNVPPFVAKQLIQRLVTSNPSPNFVRRVAEAFADNGAGVRGDMKTVIRAILTDPEARSNKILADPVNGKLREPIIRLVNWARAFGVASPSDAWTFGDTSNTSNRLGQSPGRSPSVFNFFRPGYAPPNTAIAAQGLVAPEFQVTNEATVIAYLNYMQSLIRNGAGDAVPNYADLLAKAADSAALIADVNLVLTGNQLSAATLATIRAAVDSISATTTSGPANRVYTAILLTMASPDYLVQR